MQKFYGRYLNCEIVPLPLAIKLVLIPLKMRKPKKKSDRALGYINYYCIIGARQVTSKKSIELIVNENTRLNLYQGVDSSKRNIHKGIRAFGIFRATLNLDFEGIDNSLEYQLFKKMTFKKY